MKNLAARASVVALVSGVLLQGCTDPTAMAVNRSNGEVGRGTIQNAYAGNSGPMTLAFANESYSGQWVAVRDSGTQSFGLLASYGGLTAASMSVQSDTGFGTALLASDRGNSLRCEYRYSLVTVTAIGVCQRQDGVILDLQVAIS
jgi:hypothetical protein